MLRSDSITPKMFKHACLVAAPCNCKAPIAYTFVYPPDKVGLTLFEIDIEKATVEEIFKTPEFPDTDDQDDLGLRCIRCGADWTPFNPLFFPTVE